MIYIMFYICLVSKLLFTALCEDFIVKRERNKVLFGKTVWEVSLPSWPVCMELCTRMTVCKSINFIAANKTCQINSAIPSEPLHTCDGISFISRTTEQQGMAGNCKNHTCKINEVCIEDTSGYVCRSLLHNTCGSHPCLHGGQCDVLSDGYRCACKNGYSGRFCEIFLWTNISSPTYPDSYKTAEYKEYLITVTCGYNVLLNFTYFDTEQNFDLVTVYDGDSMNGSILAQLSGIVRTSVKSTGNTMFIKWNSDSSIVGMGWYANVYRYG